MLPTNHMLVEARINGKGPYRLIFDLGAPITLLSNRASEASGVVKADAPALVPVRDAGRGRDRQAPGRRADGHQAAGDRLRPPDPRGLGRHAVGRRIDGIMGFTLFARYKTTIDYQAHQMTFEPVDYEVRDLLKDLPDRLMGPKVARAPGAGALGRLGTAAG